jgi:hypothetical protein
MTLLCMVVADGGGRYKLFPLQPQHPFTLLHILQYTTQALIVQCIHLCSIILMTIILRYSLWNIFRSIYGLKRLKERLPACLRLSVFW